MNTQQEMLDTVLSEEDAELAKIAQRCLMKALDHSRAQKIILVDETSPNTAPTLEVPPMALRLFADLLGAMGQRQVISLVPQGHEMTTQDAAGFLNVSRPYVIKLINERKLACRKVGRHRRIQYEDLVRLQQEMKSESAAALQELANDAQALKLGY